MLDTQWERFNDVPKVARVVRLMIYVQLSVQAAANFLLLVY